MSKKKKSFGAPLPYPIYKFWIVGSGGQHSNYQYAYVPAFTKKDAQEVLKSKAFELFGSMNDQPSGVRSYNWKKTNYKTLEEIYEKQRKAERAYGEAHQYLMECNRIIEVIEKEFYHNKLEKVKHLVPVLLAESLFSSSAILQGRSRDALDSIHDHHFNGSPESSIQEVIKNFLNEHKTYSKNNR